MQTTSYKRKPLLVEAVQVTEENLAEVAIWAAGTVFDSVKKHVEIDVIHPLHAKQRRASTGDWVLKSDQGFKIYADSAFKKSFEAVTDAAGEKFRSQLSAVSREMSFPTAKDAFEPGALTFKSPPS